MRQYEAVIQTIENLGGIATLGEINQNVFKISDCKWGTKTPFASIRRIVQTNPEIYKIKPGLYALLKYKRSLDSSGIQIETEHNKESKEIVEFNHSYYQGIIATLGNLRSMHTFIPYQDKNKLFINKTLGNIATLDKLPSFSYETFLSRCRTIDVIWFNERMMPTSLFEVEHTTDIQNSLLKFNDMQDFYVNMVIVADIKRKQEYLRKINYSAFNSLLHPINRVKFLSYDDLCKQYEFEIEKQIMETTI